MIPWSAWLIGALIAPTFDDLVPRSDRIVVATIDGPIAGSVRLADGREIPLGVKDPATGAVFTPYRINVKTCLLESDETCVPGASEMSIPGGNVYETIDGELRLRTWEVAGGVSIPATGHEALLLMRKSGDRHLLLGKKEALRVPQPTSEILHGIPTYADGNGSHALQQCGAGVRAGESPERGESPLELGTDHGSSHGGVVRRRSCGS